MRKIFIYDDTGRKSEIISDIIGDKGFSDVVVKKKRLEEYYKEVMNGIDLQGESGSIWWDEDVGKKFILLLNTKI